MLRGSVCGSLCGSVSGNVCGSVCGSVRGSVYGSVCGNVCGNVCGRVSDSGADNRTWNIVTIFLLVYIGTFMIVRFLVSNNQISILLIPNYSEILLYP